MTEQERAALWRQQRREQRLFIHRMRDRLKGDPLAAVDLRAAWQPVTGLGRRSHGDPWPWPCCDDQRVGVAAGDAP